MKNEYSHLRDKEEGLGKLALQQKQQTSEVFSESRRHGKANATIREREQENIETPEWSECQVLGSTHQKPCPKLIEPVAQQVVCCEVGRQLWQLAQQCHTHVDQPGCSQSW
jgi:hypothetical protein